jgi:uncharacterized lipoprotein NlpE involved in copper resistance
MIMKTSNRIFRLSFSILAIAGLQISTASAQDVLGRWKCSMSMADPSGEGSVSADFDVTFNADGSYARTGAMSIVMAALQVDTSFTMAETGTWTKDAMMLTTKTDEIAFESTDDSPSQIEQMILQQMEASAQNAPEDSIMIKSLTATTMSLETGDGEDEVMMCEKA